MIEYFHNQSSNVELFILQALKFAQSHNTSILFYITLDFIQFKLLTGFNNQIACQQIYSLIRKCEQLQQQNSLDLYDQSKPLLLTEIFPKSLLTNVKAHFYRLIGDKMLYSCHNRLSIKNQTSSIGYTKSSLDLYSDYELLSSRSIPTSDSSCYRLLITHFIELRDRENVNLLMNQYKNIMDNTLVIDTCDLLYLESLIAYHLDNNIHESVTKMKLCFQSSTEFNFIQLVTVYLTNCELLKNEETTALILPYLLKAIDFCEKNHFETHKNRLLLYLYKDVDYLTNSSHILTHGSKTDIAYYHELRGLKHNRVDDLKVSLSHYLKSFCLHKSQQLCYKLAHLTKDVSYCKLYTSIHRELVSLNTLNLLRNETPLSIDTQMDRSISYFKTLIQSLLKELP
ncbi:predicted protein [Naegleria gruberi]|uniref:Predicted protein n=1 Tax=Naegleria gruberi TaxID=5762 RepID=D2V3D4_NAEGR|nr:uncharacterized protein NAEGRDRAFT_63318 [Naegleria gruberi]EFC48752.1 predicted protein [Naegleria gruberi]|eukprot:XP_002681496.1 predicted protein [Naegleria gruberi strain NEG-M]